MAKARESSDDWNGLVRRPFTLRIAHITHHYKPIVGGQEVLTEALIQVLGGLGANQQVFQADWGARADGIVLVPRLPNRLRIGALDQYVFQLRLLSSHYSSLRNFDLLIVHYAMYYPLLSWHPRTVVLSHGVNWNRPLRKLHHRFLRFLARATFKGTDVVANDTDYLREMGLSIAPRQRYFEEISPGKWFIPNCVDTLRFKPSESIPELGGKRVVLVPRNLRVERGIHVAIEAFAQVHRRHPEAVLVIVGTTWVSAYRKFCEDLVQRFSLGKSVCFWGSASREIMPRMYSSSIVNVIPSIQAEGTSLSALEGMACGVPTIASNVGGLLDIPCIHFPNGDINALAQSICSLLENEAFRKEVALRQRAAVESGFNLERWKDAWKHVVVKSLG